MKQSVKTWLRRRAGDEQGVTLIELIASLSLVSVVLGVVYSSITFGMSTYNKVRIENSLRDEGDLIMSSIITKLYTYGPDEITQDASDTNRRRITLEPPITGSGDQGVETIEIRPREEGQPQSVLYIAGVDISTVSDIMADQSSIRLVCRENQNMCSSGLIEIQLRLEQTYGDRSYHLDLESKFGF
ncbi:prepilin-type N-terminal cleavage/methylation domain-containing protein [Paenibacillus methanolicus]|uniref:Prepilin-type N-terminal cleavage/methylation domain-containing protein n=1 Tax=Paenibacillus methanolicus TaxID=582686 RepID=A0A5S5BT39_9BACL|nr:prepilin-type N-terminal cleavage/methylation domain-containing protein [Paenibacillus methanolicus]TYP70104.1 prepilin-type N-terminal cleavage/methylation domain-containing protein [Paenibacillus methanolicus]